MRLSVGRFSPPPCKPGSAQWAPIPCLPWRTFQERYPPEKIDKSPQQRLLAEFAVTSVRATTAVSQSPSSAESSIFAAISKTLPGGIDPRLASHSEHCSFLHARNMRNASNPAQLRFRSQLSRNAVTSSGGLSQACASVWRYSGRTRTVSPRPLSMRKASSSVKSSPR